MTEYWCWNPIRVFNYFNSKKELKINLGMLLKDPASTLRKGQVKAVDS